MIREDIVDYYKLEYTLGQLEDLSEQDFIAILTTQLYTELPFYFTGVIYNCLDGYASAIISKEDYESTQLVTGNYERNGEDKRVLYLFTEDVGFTRQSQETYKDFFEHMIRAEGRETSDKSTSQEALETLRVINYGGKLYTLYNTFVRYLGEEDGNDLMVRHRETFVKRLREFNKPERAIKMAVKLVNDTRDVVNERKSEWIEEYKLPLNHRNS